MADVRGLVDKIYDTRGVLDPGLLGLNTRWDSVGRVHSVDWVGIVSRDLVGVIGQRP